MATWNNASKNSSSFTNQPFGLGDLTWDEATMSWDDASGTWDVQKDAWTKQSKNTSTFVNETKH